MAVRTGIGLKSLQFLLRTIIFLCAIVVLAIFAYFLAKLHSRNLYIPTWVRAVEGLSGAAALYLLIALLALWCLAGHTLSLLAAVLLDICFIGAFIYIASANRGGAKSCSRRSIRTPFGTGNADVNRITNRAGESVHIPSFRVSCRLEKACLAVSVIAIGFLLLSIATEFLLARNYRREKRFGPGPNNGYTSGSGRRRGLFGKKRNAAAVAGADYQDPNALPQHAEPSQMRESYATEATAVGHHYGDNGVVDPNKPVEPYRNYGNNLDNSNVPAAVPASTVRTANDTRQPAAHGVSSSYNSYNSYENTAPHGSTAVDNTAFRGTAAAPSHHRPLDNDPSLHSRVNPAPAAHGTTLAEAPEAPTVRGTGVDNYANIRPAATGRAGAAAAGSGVEDYSNVRGAAVDPSVWGGAIDPATGRATGLRTNAEAEAAARGFQEQVSDSAAKYGNPPQF